MNGEDDIDEAQDNYWSWLHDYNWRTSPSCFSSWEDGDKGGEYYYVDNPTFGYWEDYYNDQESDYPQVIDSPQGREPLSGVFERDRFSNFISSANGTYYILDVPEYSFARIIGIMPGDKIVRVEYNSNDKSVILRALRKSKEVCFSFQLYNLF